MPDEFDDWGYITDLIVSPDTLDTLPPEEELSQPFVTYLADQLEKIKAMLKQLGIIEDWGFVAEAAGFTEDWGSVA